MTKQPFRQLLTPFLEEKLRLIEACHGRESSEYQALARQYIRATREDASSEETNLRHYDADVRTCEDSPGLPGVERLYRRTLVVEPTLACAAHCRHCIRANYPRHNLTESELSDVARYCGAPSNREDLREVLITGGDPLLIPRRVESLLEALREHAPNIRTVRIATRIPAQAPEMVNGEVLRLFEDKQPLRLELATQINHRIELFPEVVDAFRRIMDRGVGVYAQNVLLRGVNDDVDTLVDLYDALRDVGIQPYYLFHCVPLMGMGHLRTTVQRAVELANGLTSSGMICGRAKPMLAAMTEIGKIVLYDGGVLRRDNRRLLLQSHYHVEDRRRWNPAWQLPANAEVDRHGLLRVWYLDGHDDDADLLAHTADTERDRGVGELAQALSGRESSATCVRQTCGRT